MSSYEAGWVRWWFGLPGRVVECRWSITETPGGISWCTLDLGFKGPGCSWIRSQIRRESAVETLPRRQINILLAFLGASHIDVAKGMAMADYTDPISRFSEAVSIANQARDGSSARITPKDLAELIPADGVGSGANRSATIQTLSAHVSQHTSLTAYSASALLESAIPKDASKDVAASTASTAVAGSIPSADVELSDPVMLWPPARVAFSAVLVVLLGVSVWLIYKLANSSVTVSGASPSSQNIVPTTGFVALIVIGVLSLIGVLVLVMGYKNVTIKSGASS